MLKLLSLFALLSTQTFAQLPIEETLMYECNNAALAMGGYDEYYVNLTLNLDTASEENVADFEDFASAYLKVKSVKYRNSKRFYVVRAADLTLWFDVALMFEDFIAREGFYGSCHLDL